MTKIKEAHAYIANCYGFDNFSFYPEQGLNKVSQNFLAQSGWKNDENWRRVPRPNISAQKLIDSGMDSQKARLCVFLMEQRDLFNKITAYGDGQTWQQGNSGDRSDFINQYYAIAAIVLREPTDDKINRKESINLKRAVIRLNAMAQESVGETYKNQRNYSPQSATSCLTVVM